MSSEAEILTEAGRRLLQRLDAGGTLPPIGDPMELAIAGATLSLAVGRRFPHVPSVANLGPYVRALTAGTDAESLPVLETEALLRAIARGDGYLLRNVDAELLARIQLVLLPKIIRDLPGRNVLIELLAAAESHVSTLGDVTDPSDEDLVMTVSLDVPAEHSEMRQDQRNADSEAALKWIVDAERSPLSTRPRTSFGCYFRAAAVGDTESRDRWGSILADRGNANVGHGIRAIFLVSLDRRFETLDVDAVGDFSRRYAAFFDGVEDGGRPLETEMVIRIALAERHHQEPPARAEDLAIPITHLQLGAALGMALDMNLTEAELDALILDAEDLAARNGRPLSPAHDSRG
jgi:hypothetical protein